MSKLIEQRKKELKGILEALPFKKIEIPEFNKKGFEPKTIRQERTYVKTTHMLAIGRFLMERGSVEILSTENTIALFTEIHWCIYQIYKFSNKRYKTATEIRKGLIEVRRLVSRMEAAEEELFIANRRLIARCVKPYFWIGQVWLADFLQEGSKALSNAIRKFDFTRGTLFYSYAQKSIQNRMRNYFRDHVRSGSVGIRPSEEMIRIKQIMDKRKEEHQAESSPYILSKMTGLEEEKINKLLPLIKQWQKLPSPILSLDAEFGDDMSTLHEILEDKEAEEASLAAEKSEIWSAIETLPERARQILQLRFIEGRTLEETGEQINLTRARIKQIQDESLRKLRQMLKHGIKKPKM